MANVALASAIPSTVADRKRKIAKALDTALTRHVADCPLRTQGESS